MSSAEFIRELREKYPNPIKTPQGVIPDVGTYCVGGALALERGFVGWWGYGAPDPAEPGRLTADAPRATGSDMKRQVGVFPDSPALAGILCGANTNLSFERALAYAKAITEKNDTGNFETAWMHLADALGYAEGEWTPADDVAVAEFLTGATS